MKYNYWADEDQTIPFKQNLEEGEVKIFFTVYDVGSIFWLNYEGYLNVTVDIDFKYFINET